MLIACYSVPPLQQQPLFQMPPLTLEETVNNDFQKKNYLGLAGRNVFSFRWSKSFIWVLQCSFTSQIRHLHFILEFSFYYTFSLFQFFLADCHKLYRVWQKSYSVKNLDIYSKMHLKCKNGTSTETGVQVAYLIKGWIIACIFDSSSILKSSCLDSWPPTASVHLELWYWHYVLK